MGDAGPQHQQPQAEVGDGSLREIHVLVTGFGPFKSFTNNPSWLIASSLPTELSSVSPESILSAQPPSKTWASHQAGPSRPLRKPDTRPYRVHLHTYPEPVRVAYASTSVFIPSLLSSGISSLSQRPFDYILHIGLASGRDSYTLETNGHRDHYDTKDVDDEIGKLAGESIWRRTNVPGRLEVGWNMQDVLDRWVDNVRMAEAEQEKLNVEVETLKQDPPAQAEAPPLSNVWRHRWTPGNSSIAPGMLTAASTTSVNRQNSTQDQKRTVVRLSRDAGRFLCEFILMCSLVYLWQQAQRVEGDESPIQGEDAREKVGKVAFLHVPNGTEEVDVARGKLVAEAAIRALVTSWEAGYRNPNVYSPQTVVAAEPIEVGAGTEPAAFESRGTGDA